LGSFNQNQRSKLFPIGIVPYTIIIKNNKELINLARTSWDFLLSKKLTGKIIFPQSPRIIWSIAQKINSSSSLKKLKSQALLFDDKNILNWLINSDAIVAIVPYSLCSKYLKIDPRLSLVFPSQGVPLMWHFLLSRSNLNNAILIKWIKSLENKSIVDKLVSQGWYLPFNSDYLQSKYKTEMLPISGPSEKCWENSWSFPVLTNEQKINLKNKYALVTGAGKGLGRACSIALAEAGATIIGLSRTSSDLDKLEKDIKKVKSKLIKINCDVMNYSELQEKLKKIKIIDILVNNAGTNIPEPFEKIKQQSMNYLVDLNLKAAFNVAQLVVKKMIKNKKRGGSIINMSSQLGHVGMSGRNIYNMTKFGIEGLTKGMGVELATRNIRVNTVAPTFVETPMVKKFFKNKKFKNLALGNIPMGKAAKESDVATAVCFLASDAAAMITGSSILIDGGWTAK